MVDFRPFRGWRYNQAVIGDLASVLGPPYDLVTPELRESLRQRSPYNVVHLEAGEGLDWSAPEEGQYSSTAEVFAQWTKQGVLRREDRACFYLSRHGFEHQGQQRSRLGLTGCVRLEDYDKGQVLPHEYTEEPAIRDRMTIMRACDANFSPIMALYRDADQRLGRVLDDVMRGPPIASTIDESGQEMALWRISDPGTVGFTQRFFSEASIFLADGHHRYEAARRFAEESNAQATGDGGLDTGHNFVMMTLIGFDDPGLLVLPYHRLLSNLSEHQFARIESRLSDLFESETVPAGSISADDLTDLVATAGGKRRVIGMVTAHQEQPRLLTLQEKAEQPGWGPLATAEGWILEEQVLRPVLGAETLRHLGYIHDHQEAFQQVRSGVAQAAFILKSFPMAEFQAIVSEGHRLPRKSTFFYPKLPTGLVINQLDEAI